MDEDSIPEEGDKHNETEIRNNKLNGGNVFSTTGVRCGFLGNPKGNGIIRSYYRVFLPVIATVFWIVFLLT